MGDARHFDVGVIGAGPAGATLGRILAGLGYRVALFHRPHDVSPGAAWQTLSPGALELLRRQQGEVWPKIERHLLNGLATIDWSRADSASPATRAAVFIDRRHLDRLLLLSARAAGAAIFTGRSVVLHHRKFWVVRTETPIQICCRLLVDAAGRHSVLPGSRIIHSARTVALTAKVAGSSLLEAQSRVEALEQAWFWAARGLEAQASVTLFAGIKTARRGQAEARTAAFLQLLETSSLSHSKRSLRVVSRITAVDATIAERQPVFENQIIRIGDAALSLDPLASQGIHHALLSAQYAAAAINTTLGGGREELAAQFMRLRHDEALQNHLVACRALYRRQDKFETAFWRERSGNEPNTPAKPPLRWSPSAADVLETPFVLSPLAQWEMVPVLVDLRIESGCALRHPGLARSCAFLENQPVSPLLVNLRSAINGAALLKRWIEQGLSAATARRILVFLLRHQVLVPVEAHCLSRPGAATTSYHAASRAAATALPAASRRD